MFVVKKKESFDVVIKRFFFQTVEVEMLKKDAEHEDRLIFQRQYIFDKI